MTWITTLEDVHSHYGTPVQAAMVKATEGRIDGQAHDVDWPGWAAMSLW